MRYPDAPFLELGFQFHNLSGREAIQRLAKVILEGETTKPVSAEILKSYSGVLLGSDRDRPRIRQKLRSSAELLRLVSDPESLVTKIVVEGATQLVRDASEIITMIPIESDEPSDCGNSVAICLEGASLSFPVGDASIPTKILKMGAKVRTIFVDFVRMLKPSYASITVDYGLEAPCDLRKDPRTHAFRDFFLSSERYDALTQEIRRKFPNIYFDQLPTGQFITTSQLFSGVIMIPNPAACDPYSLSEYVGRRIAMM